MTYQVDLVKDVFDPLNNGIGNNLVYFGFTAEGNNSNEQRVYIKSICEGSNGESIFKGYTDPNDLDEDGKFDFQQAGDIPEFTDSYEDNDIVIVNEGTDTTFTSSVTYEGSGDIVWQICDDECGSCLSLIHI